MFKYKLKSINEKEIVWDVKYRFKFGATVKDYIQVIKETAEHNKNYEYTIWIYGGGFTVGYVFFHGDEARYYCNKNLDLWDAKVTRCECRLRGPQYLFRIWTKDNYSTAIVPVRPIIPQIFLRKFVYL